MQIIDLYGNICPTLYTLDLVSGKWKLPILWKLSEHKYLRFNELKNEVTGITNIMLAKCLKEFEEKNIVKRIQYEEIPPRVEYSLTESGKELVGILDCLREWGVRNM